MKILKKLLSLINKKNYIVRDSAIIEGKVRIGDNTEIQEYVIIKSVLNDVEIGSFCQLNPFVVIYGGSGVKIGDNVMIGPGTVLAAGNHNYKQTEKPIRFAGSISNGPIVIEDNVWIGANCTLTDGITIGHDSVVGANSVVTKSVEPYSVVGGVPAKLIIKRK